MRIFELLGGEPKRPAEMRAFLLSEYGQEPDGGFEVGHHLGWKQNHYSRTEDTYCAVKTLELMGEPLTRPRFLTGQASRSDCIAWLSSLQNPDGGFARIGINEHTLLPSPSEMRSTLQAVAALNLLGAAIPQPRQPKTPENEVVAHRPKYLHPCVNEKDPAEVWAFRRIALPIIRAFPEC